MSVFSFELSVVSYRRSVFSWQFSVVSYRRTRRTRMGWRGILIHLRKVAMPLAPHTGLVADFCFSIFSSTSWLGKMGKRGNFGVFMVVSF